MIYREMTPIIIFFLIKNLGNKNDFNISILNLYLFLTTV